MSDLLNSASLVMIPSGYKEDVVYSQIPTDGSGDLSFTRASNGTRVNSAGLVEVVPWNLAQYSEDFSNAVWNKYQSAITANAISAPNGTTTADKLEYTTTGTAVLFATSSALQNQVYTLSCYGKKGTTNIIQIGFTLSGGDKIANFNLNTGVITTTSSGVNASIESVGNGWYRCIMSLTTDINTPNIFINSTSGTTGEYIYIWGAQLNIGSTAKPYFPTTDRLNVPRLTYQNGGGGCPSLLLEKQSTNLTLYSEQIDNAYWAKQGGTATANATTSPDGTQNADLFTENSATEDHAIFDIVTYFVSGTTYTISFYAKANGRTKVELVSANSGTCPSGRFDLVAQTATALGTSFNAKIESVGNGWFRCSVSRVAPNTGLDVPYYAMVQTFGTITYTGNGTSGMYFWGMQSEASSYPTSYIPTTSSSATRVADYCSKTSATAIIPQTEGVIYFDYNIINYDTNNIFVLYTQGTAYSDIGLAYYNGVFYVSIYDTTLQVQLTYSAMASVGRYKVAFAYKQNDFVLYVNGALIGSDTSGTVPSMSAIQIANTTYAESWKINEYCLFNTRLTNAELASLTTI